MRSLGCGIVEKISLQKPEMLRSYKPDLLGLLEEAQQQELRWHLAQIVPRLQLTKAEVNGAATHLWRYLEDRSSIVRTCALQSLADLSRLDPGLRRSVRNALGEAMRTGTAAMKARSRKLLALMSD